jgi:2-polyprenyl-3-methyl-5-hydroxy-6-metoxy-1,4-benzoquinol methylase
VGRRQRTRGASAAGPVLALVEAGCVVCGGVAAAPEAIGPDFEHHTVPGEFRFVRCRSCGHLYLSPRPAPEDVASIYPADYYAYADDAPGVARRLRRWREARKVRIYRRAIGEGRRRILDVGCGSGRLLSMLREHGAPAWELEGIDVGEDAVRRCRAKGFRAEATRIEAFEAADGAFDAVILMQILEHLDDPRGALARLSALLRPGGVLVLETPNVGGLDYRLFRGRYWGMYHFPRHWNLFSTTALTRLLEDAGFAVERADYLLSTSSWILSLHHLLLERGWPERVVRFFHFQNPVLLPFAAGFDLARLGLRLDTSDQRVIARKTA